MVIIARELLQYDKDNTNYYINFPKLYIDREKDLLKKEMIEKINKDIFEDILIFMELIEETHWDINEKGILMNSLTEFKEGFNFHNVISIAIEYSQIRDFMDISYIKAYNYDLDLKKEILLQDLFKDEVDFSEILRSHIKEQLKKILSDIYISQSFDLHESIVDNICIDSESIFYFSEDHLVLPFSSFEIDSEIMNLIEFKIAFNSIYPYLSKYAVKKVVHKVIL
ncbi:MAG: hypothetical protein RSG52_07235 [Terrisporobacter sp.]|uniref:DUF3298 domain-containing protein n=1 Tax=Terrisporobacter sp. TaxID=1965305 RepID=UPI002FC73419